MKRKAWTSIFILLALLLLAAGCSESDDMIDGDESDGDMTDGDESDGDMTDGDMMDGDESDGDMADGDMMDGDEDGDMIDGDMVHNPDTAEKASIDRFSEDAATLFVRTAENGLPEANAAIDFDMGPFITKGLGPDGQAVEYYNFDVQPLTPAPIFVLFREGEDMPVEGQLNIIDVIPGDAGYNDFWQPHKVTVPADYQANQVASLEEITAVGYDIEPLDILVNCPVVPDGSTATKRYIDEEKGLISGWYKGKLVKYFSFTEKMLAPDGDGKVPLSDILVTFNINPDENNPASGPASGFVTEEGTDQTHNVVETIPEDEAYSPLWDVDVYDNAGFSSVMDYASAMNANILAEGVASVNCPIVFAEELK